MITVIMPAYNCQSTIQRAIESILNQDLKFFEFIIVNDNSSDNTLKLINGYCDKRIRVISNKKNLGVAKSLNLAIENAKYNYIARMDADDESLPCRLKKQYKFLLKHKDVAIVGGPYYFMGITPKLDFLQKLPTHNKDIKDCITQSNPLCHPSVMFKKEPIVSIGGYREFFKNSEDYDLWLRVSKTHKLANLSSPVLRYNLISNGVTIQKRWEMHIFHHLALASFHNPNENLESLYIKVLAEQDSSSKHRRKILLSYYKNILFIKLRTGFILESLYLTRKMISTFIKGI